jgi:hypothetical protein
MERLIKLSERKINAEKTAFKRFLYNLIDWNQPFKCLENKNQITRDPLYGPLFENCVL